MSKGRWCNFCGKSEAEVSRLVAGPQLYICNECIDLMHDVIHSGSPVPDDPDPKPMEATRLGQELIRRRAARKVEPSNG